MSDDTTSSGPGFSRTPGKEVQVGQVLGGRYEILSKLGVGTFSSVYQARDRDLGADYAIKILRNIEADRETIQRFKREALLSQRVANEDCCRIFDFIVLDGFPMLKMELVDGMTLAQLQSQMQPIPVRLALILAAQAAASVAVLHRNGVIHRDIKASNLMLTRAGRVKVMDLGISWAPELSSLTMAGTLLGTPSYMAPELILTQQAFPQTDVYALGALSYSLLTGRLPFAATDLVRLFMLQVNETPAPPRLLRPDLPQGIDSLILRCLDKDPQRRPADASKLEEEWRTSYGIVPDPELVRDVVFSGAAVPVGPVPIYEMPTGSLPSPSLEDETRREPMPIEVVERTLGPDDAEQGAGPKVGAAAGDLATLNRVMRNLNQLTTPTPKPTEPALTSPKAETPSPAPPSPKAGGGNPGGNPSKELSAPAARTPRVDPGVLGTAPAARSATLSAAQPSAAPAPGRGLPGWLGLLIVAGIAAAIAAYVLSR